MWISLLNVIEAEWFESFTNESLHFTECHHPPPERQKSKPGNIFPTWISSTLRWKSSRMCFRYYIFSMPVGWKGRYFAQRINLFFFFFFFSPCVTIQPAALISSPAHLHLSCSLGHYCPTLFSVSFYAFLSHFQNLTPLAKAGWSSVFLSSEVSCLSVRAYFWAEVEQRTCWAYRGRAHTKPSTEDVR